MSPTTKTIAIIAALTGTFIGLPLYDASLQPSKVEYVTDVTWSGYNVVNRVSYSGLFGIRGTPERIGYFGGGNPAVVAFGCEGAPKGILIAVEGVDLEERCELVRPIANHRDYLQTA